MEKTISRNKLIGLTQYQVDRLEALRQDLGYRIRERLLETRPKPPTSSVYEENSYVNTVLKLQDKIKATQFLAEAFLIKGNKLLSGSCEAEQAVQPSIFDPKRPPLFYWAPFWCISQVIRELDPIIYLLYSILVKPNPDIVYYFRDLSKDTLIHEDLRKEFENRAVPEEQEGRTPVKSILTTEYDPYICHQVDKFVWDLVDLLRTGPHTST